MLFIATLVSGETNEEYTDYISGESVETVGEYICNCGEYGEDDLLLSVKEAE